MAYRLDLQNPRVVSSPIAKESTPHSTIADFVPWRSSTWPASVQLDDQQFTLVIKRIIESGILSEINNVIEDATIRNGSLIARGSVICLASLCALDAISAFGYGGRSGKQIPEFIRAHFPQEYQPFADQIRQYFRNASVHSWNLFGAEIFPGREGITYRDGRLSFGLLNFFDALKNATEDFLEQLAHNSQLQRMARSRYESRLSLREGLLGT